jgi:hypothetical protein
VGAQEGSEGETCRWAWAHTKRERGGRVRQKEENKRERGMGSRAENSKEMRLLPRDLTNEDTRESKENSRESIIRRAGKR